MSGEAAGRGCEKSARSGCSIHRECGTHHVADDYRYDLLACLFLVVAYDFGQAEPVARTAW